MSMSMTTGVMFITAMPLYWYMGQEHNVSAFGIIILDGWYTSMYNSVTNPVRVRPRQVVFVRYGIRYIDLTTIRGIGIKGQNYRRHGTATLVRLR